MLSKIICAGLFGLAILPAHAATTRLKAITCPFAEDARRAMELFDESDFQAVIKFMKMHYCDQIDGHTNVRV
jgi:hypothetical protein